MGLTLYQTLLSQPCRAIVMFLRVNNIPFDTEVVSFVNGETRSPQYRAINPLQMVPALKDGEFLLTESTAILRYLAKRADITVDWYPKDTHQRARVDEYMAWQTSNIRPKAARVFIEQALKPHRTGQPVDHTTLTDRMKDLQEALDTMENHFLIRGDFIAGQALTFADVLGVCELMQPMSVGYDVMKGHPKLDAWFDRTKTRLQPHFDDVHKEIMEFSFKHKL